MVLAGGMEYKSKDVMRMEVTSQMPSAIATLQGQGDNLLQKTHEIAAVDIGLSIEPLNGCFLIFIFSFAFISNIWRYERLFKQMCKLKCANSITTYLNFHFHMYFKFLSFHLT